MYLLHVSLFLSHCEPYPDALTKVLMLNAFSVMSNIKRKRIMEKEFSKLALKCAF